jgi:hypothetical protein
MNFTPPLESQPHLQTLPVVLNQTHRHIPQPHMTGSAHMKGSGQRSPDPTGILDHIPPPALVTRLCLLKPLYNSCVNTQPQASTTHTFPASNTRTACIERTAALWCIVHVMRSQRGDTSPTMHACAHPTCTRYPMHHPI